MSDLHDSKDKLAEPLVLAERRGRVGLLTLNRPAHLNALSDALIDLLGDELEAMDADESIGVIVIVGAGKAFAAGADIGAMAEWSHMDVYKTNYVSRNWDRLARVRKPVIAAVRGFALGGGCELAMACHLRVASETAQFGQPEVQLGLIAGYGGTQRLPRLIGRTKALELLILGTQVPAAECLALGLVNRVCREGETLEDAKALARQLAKRPPIATRLLIEAVDDGLEAPIDKALEIETRAFQKTLRTEDAAEGLQAFFAKREPRFEGR